MTTTCTRCESTGFLNVFQVPQDVRDRGHEAILKWIDEQNAYLAGSDCSCHIAPPCPRCEHLHDVQVCDCCGNGDDAWHGVPGEHYGPDDPPGDRGPYAYNGGLCKCH